MRSRPPRSAALLSLAPILLVACRSEGGATEGSVGSRASEPRISLTLDFDRSNPGDRPSGFTIASGQWSVRADQSGAKRGNVVAQTGDGGKEPFNVLLLDNVKASEVDVAVKLRPVAGEIDQGGGVAWRLRDTRNYYLARWNPLEKNVRVYKVIDGERRQLASEDLRADGGWHELRVTMKGEQIRCTVDGRACGSARDGSFSEPGRIGLWTKADAQTEFDELKISAPR
jgi:hypothetical protein